MPENFKNLFWVFERKTWIVCHIFSLQKTQPMNFFLVVGIIGFVLVMVSMFSGYDGDLSVDHDVGHGDGGDSISVFSFRTITTFMTAFGGVGWLCMYFGKGILFSSVAGTGCGLVFGFIAWWLTSFAVKQQASSLVGGQDFVGKEAIVHIDIPVNGNGEVQIELSGQRKYMSAQTNDKDPIPNGVVVSVLKHVSGVLIVTRKNSSQTN